MDKLEYLALMLNQRTNGKKYENFVINAIYAKVANPNLIPVTQKYVRNPNYPNSDNRQYYFMDLYFPQLNYGIEVDEPAHENQANQESDKIRKKDILDAVDCTISPIKIGKDEKTLQTIEEVNKQIDNEVIKIKELIAKYEKKENKKLSWKDEETLKNEVLTKGIFDLEDGVTYKGIKEICIILEQFGKNLRHGCIELNDSYGLWVPHLARCSKDGSVITRNGCKNTLNEDGTIIEEISKNKKKSGRKNTSDGSLNENGMKTIVFMHVQNNFGLDEVRFLGVFKVVQSDIIKEGEDEGKEKRTYKRVETSVKIDDLKPRKK